MTITSALVLFAVIWFMTLFVFLPLRLTTQGESGRIVPGTHSGSPETTHLRAKFIVTTLVAAVIWAVAFGVVTWGGISVRDLDIFGRMPAPLDDRGG